MPYVRAKDVSALVVDAMLVAYLALLIRAYVRSSPALQAELTELRERASSNVRRLFERVRTPITDEDFFAARAALEKIERLPAEIAR